MKSERFVSVVERPIEIPTVASTSILVARPVALRANRVHGWHRHCVKTNRNEGVNNAIPAPSGTGVRWHI